MNLLLNLSLTYIFLGMLTSFIFYFFIRRSILKNYFFCLLFGIIGSFLGGFLNALIPFDPLKYIYFFREVFTIGIFWPVLISFIVLLGYSEAIKNN